MEAPAQPRRGRLLLARAVLAAVLAAVAAGAAWWLLWAKPEADAAMRRARVADALVALHALQEAHWRATGAYASDLDSLLRLSPRGADLRARLAAEAHLDTLVIAASGPRFKLEANARDPQRTLIRLKGPLAGAPGAGR